mmetsp:Transcript_32135/g.65092  ORF Transcript_32135/g.65092 Transcript_32135/m.65092 type:complete len:1326 (+) Transcript_32135:167-4144(+)
MRIERSKYTSPPSPVEAFRRVSSKIGRKSTNTNFNDDDSNHRLLDRSSWDQSDDQRDDDMLPFNPTGKFVRKTAPMSPLGALKSPRSMKKALMSRVNAAVEHNSYFGHHESRDDDESNVGLLSRDGQYETRYENRWFDAGDDDDEDDVAQMSQTNNVASTKPLLPDLVDFSGSSESTESSKDNATATIMTSSAPGNEQERDGASASHRESLAYSVESKEEVAQELQEEEVGTSTNDFDQEESRVTASVARPASLELDEIAEIELEGSSSTVDFDDELSLAEHPVDDNLSLAEHPESIVQYETPVEVEEESEKKSIASSPTDIKSYLSYTRHDCPVVVSSSEHGDVILLSPKGFENIISAEATSSALSVLEKDEESQDLSNKFEAIALADPSVNSRQDFVAETGQSNNQDEKADSDDEDDEFVISDDWSEDSSVGNSSDPFGECIVNENVVQNIITEHRLEDNATFLGREKRVGEEVSAIDNDTSRQVSDAKPVSEASVQLSDLETNQLTSKSSSSADLASFNQIWEGSTMPEESGSDSEDCDEGKLVDKKSNDNNDAWDVSRELLEGFKTELSASGSSDDLDKSDSSKSEDRDSFVSLNNYWASEWNDLTVDDNKNIQDSLHEEDVEEDTGAHDKYSTALEEEDSDDFYGRGIVESSGDYSYDSYGLETISEEGEVDEDEPVMPPSCDEPVKKDEAVVEKEEDQVDVQVIETVKECIASGVPVDADEDVSLTAKHTNVAREEVIVVEAVNEYSSDEEESNVEEERVQTITSNDVAGVQHEVVQSEVLHQLWSKIDEYQANNDNVENAGETPRQTTSTKAITPVKKHAVVKHSIRDNMRSPLPRVKKAGSSDPTFDDLSRFLDGSGASASLDSDASETDSNHTEVLLEDGNAKSDMKRTSVKRHVFTRLFAPVSSLVNKRRSIEQQDLGLTKSGSNDSTDGNQEDACDESNVESEDDREARELAELLSAAMMAREQEKMEKSAAFAKQLAEIREAMAMEQELAEIEGDLHYANPPVENCSSSDEDDSQIEILEEELVAETPTLDASNEVETKELQDLWSKIDEYQAKGKSLDTTQVAMMADMLNSQMEENQAPVETASAGKYSSRPLRSLKHAVSMTKRAVVNAKAKKSKYDVAYIETKSIVKNKKVTETGEDLIRGLESSGINNEPSEETKCLAEPSPSLLDLETQKTCESADLDTPPQLCLIPSAMSINSFASIISADKSSESSLGGVSKDVSDMSKGSLVSKLYSDNTDLAETLAVTQCELEKALKQVERMKKEKEDLIATAVHEPIPPKSSFDDHFEPDALVDDDDFDNEWNLENNSGLCEI